MIAELVALALLLWVTTSQGSPAELGPPLAPPSPSLAGRELARHGGRGAVLTALELGIVTPRWVPLQIGPYELAVSSDSVAAGGLRWSPTHLQAQHVADAHGALLPTPAIVDAIWNAAAVHLEPHPRGHDAAMMSVSEWLAYADRVEQDAGAPDALELVAPLGKDYVQVPELAAHPGRGAIYGWHRLDGRPIQPVHLGHESNYADYSHTARLVSRFVRRDDGSQLDLADLYLSGDPWIAPQGPTPPRHPAA